jgi:hypothetical protein
MSDHQVAALERSFDELKRREFRLYRQVCDLKIELHRERMAVNELRSEVRASQEALRREMRSGEADLRREMHADDNDQKRLTRALHEEVLDKIRFLVPGFGHSRREFRNADAELREETEDNG